MYPAGVHPDVLRILNSAPPGFPLPMYRTSALGQVGGPSPLPTMPSPFIPDPSFLQPPVPVNRAVTNAGVIPGPAPANESRTKAAPAASSKAAKQPAKQRKTTSSTGKAGRANPGRAIGLQELRQRAQLASVAQAGHALPNQAARQNPAPQPEKDDLDYDGLSGDNPSYPAWIRRYHAIHAQLASREAVNFDTITSEERGELCMKTFDFKINLNNKVDASHRIITKDGVYKATAAWFTLTYLLDTEDQVCW